MINNKFLVFIILRLCICKNSDYRVNFYELIFSLAPKLTMKLSPLNCRYRITHQFKRFLIPSPTHLSFYRGTNNNEVKILIIANKYLIVLLIAFIGKNMINFHSTFKKIAYYVFNNEFVRF